MTTEKSLYRVRFDDAARIDKEKVWRVLVPCFFQRYVNANDTVLDLGAGYCEFINLVECKRRIAVDVNEEISRFAADSVETHLCRADDLEPIQDGEVDLVFASNFFEHMPDKETLFRTWREVHRILAPGGRFMILQPNIRLIPGEYWDFIDHHIPLSDRSLVEGLTLCGFQIRKIIPRFLPYTTKSRFPKFPWLVRLYLACPPAQWLLGKQALILAQKPSTQ